MSTLLFHEDKFTKIQKVQIYYISYFVTELSFFILDFWAAFKSKGLHMDRNEPIISTWNLKLAREILSFCKSVLHICLVKAQKANFSM